MRTRHEDLEVAAKGAVSRGSLLCSPAHGDMVALVDASGTVKASDRYDACGNLTSSSESLANGWSNPYRCVGGLGVQYDPETNLYWMSVRAYDPTLGRFISHDPLGRLATIGFNFQPYIYASNNPVNYTDPSGMFFCCTGADGYSSSYWKNNSNAADIDGCKTGVGPYVSLSPAPWYFSVMVFMLRGRC